MNRKIILPGDMTADGNKWGVNLDEEDPVKILIGMHKRVVHNEKRFESLSNHVSNLQIEIGMLKESFVELKEELEKRTYRDRGL
jgi:hypothetical protein